MGFPITRDSRILMDSSWRVIHGSFGSILGENLRQLVEVICGDISGRILGIICDEVLKGISTRSISDVSISVAILE